jgi:phage shock protein PspC (stress-responsive transcriptional regulator)
MTTNSNTNPPKKLQRSDDRVIAGVCSGIAEYLNVDTTLVRVITAVLTVFGGSGILIYLIAWVVMPDSSGNVLAGRVLPRSTAQRQQFPPTEPPSTSHEPPAA